MANTDSLDSLVLGKFINKKQRRGNISGMKITLNRTFSAPKIWTVLAECLAKFIRLPACTISLAPTSSPTNTVRLGAIANMRFFRYS